MKRIGIAVTFLASCLGLNAQSIFRVDPQSLMTTAGNASPSGYPALYAVSGATIQITTDAAGTMPATTYANGTGSPACPVGSPVVLAGTSICTAYAGSQGEFGFWLAAGTYYYKALLPNGYSYGPFPITINTLGVTQITAGAGVSISPPGGTGNVTISATGSIPIVSTYNWGPVASASVLTGGNPFTLTLAPVPLGVNANNPSYSMSITGCSGGNQTVAITGGTAVSGASSGTVIFTPSVSCALGFAIGSASAGLQESICALPSAGGQVIINNTPTLLQDINTCNKTDVAVFKEPGSVVTGSFTVLGSSISGLAGSVWIGNNSYITDAGIVFPALTGVLIGNGASPVTAQAQLDVAHGGSGAGTLTGLLEGNGTSPFTALGLGTAYQVTEISGGGALQFGALPLNQSAAVSGALARANGGLNSTSPGTGLLRDGTTPAASELSGDASTSGSNAVTVTGVNGATLPAAAVVTATNGSKQIVAAAVQGAGDTKVQLSAGTGTPGNCANFDANGGTQDAGYPCNNFTLPSGNPLQYLRIQPNLTNTTTLQFASLPDFVTTDYIFPAQTCNSSSSCSAGGSSGMSITASNPTTITMNPCPLGLNGSDANHRLYISGGSGTAEAVLITSGTCASGASSGTAVFTPANSHSGAFTVQSATSGIQEAIIAAGGISSYASVKIPPGKFYLYAGIYNPFTAVSIRGSGVGTTALETVGTTGDWITYNTLGFCNLGGFEIVDSTNTAHTAGNMISMTGCTYGDISNIWIQFAYVGLYANYFNSAVEIHGNLISAAEYGVEFTGVQSIAYMHDNAVHGGVHGVDFNNTQAAGFRLTSNLIDSSGSDATTSSIALSLLIASGTDTINEFVASNNDFESLGTGIQYSGYGTYVNNPGAFTGGRINAGTYGVKVINYIQQVSFTGLQVNIATASANSCYLLSNVQDINITGGSCTTNGVGVDGVVLGGSAEFFRQHQQFPHWTPGRGSNQLWNRVVALHPMFGAWCDGHGNHEHFSWRRDEHQPDNGQSRVLHGVGFGGGRRDVGAPSELQSQLHADRQRNVGNLHHTAGKHGSRSLLEIRPERW